MTEPRSWAGEYQHGDGEMRSELVSDQELYRASDRSVAERASGDRVEVEALQAEQEQREQQLEQGRRRQQYEKERRELVEELQQIREKEAQRQREQAEEQARRQKQEPREERTPRNQEQGGGRGESEAEAIRRITAEEEGTARETRERWAQEKADLLKDLREGREHYLGEEPGSRAKEHTHYNPELQEEAATRQYENQVRQAGFSQGNGQSASPEQSRVPSIPEQTQAPEMERER